MLKKVIAMFNVMLLIISSNTCLAYAQPYSGVGEGTLANPYVIENAEQLSGIREDLDAHYKLGSDIDLIGEYWQPIGENNYPFKGSLDGDGHKIKNLVIKNQKYAGLFGSGDGAILKNISIENVNISGEAINYAGALIAELNGGQIENCAVEGSIIINNESSSTSYIGGMVGRSDSSTIIKNSQINGELSIETKSFSGGIIGYQNGGSIEECEIKGKAYINSSGSNVGGLIGYSYNNAVIKNSKITAEGLIKGESNVGGLVGISGNIEGSSSSIDVEGESAVGGLVGSFCGTVTKCYAKGGEPRGRFLRLHNVTGTEDCGKTRSQEY